MIHSATSAPRSREAGSRSTRIAAFGAGRVGLGASAAGPRDPERLRFAGGRTRGMVTGDRENTSEIQSQSKIGRPLPKSARRFAESAVYRWWGRRERRRGGARARRRRGGRAGGGGGGGGGGRAAPGAGGRGWAGGDPGDLTGADWRGSARAEY